MEENTLTVAELDLQCLFKVLGHLKSENGFIDGCLDSKIEYRGSTC